MAEIARRNFLAALFGLDRFFPRSSGAAILLDVRSRRTLAVHAPGVAAKFPAPPGSTLKPFVLSALLRRGRISPSESFVCPRRLAIAGRSFDCVHPRVAAPLRIDTALAYSCNCFVAHFAERFQAGELAAELAHAGLGIAGARMARAMDRDTMRLQALGEDGVLVTVAELASAYCSLALNCRPEILAGLEGAVDYGTAQRAQTAGARVAGKTGSVRTAAGASIAWFAGWTPSRAPEVAVAVMLQGRSGGSDAAPVAGEILSAWRARHV